LLKEQEFLKYQFLCELFDRSKTLGGKSYHKELMDLLIKFERSKLLDFFKNSDFYERLEALQACQKAKLYKEQAYLNIKIGETKEAVRLLIDSCSENINQVVELAVQFNIDDDHLWDQIIAKSKGDVGRVSTILQYADVYRDPARFLDALDDDIEIDQI
jgi:hypothetical protein